MCMSVMAVDWLFSFTDGIVMLDWSLGCGLNVNNSNPTICINDIVEIHNKLNGLKLQKLSVELTLAQMLNTLEWLLDQLDKEGISPLIDMYYKYWIHRYDLALSSNIGFTESLYPYFQWEQSVSSNR